MNPDNTDDGTASSSSSSSLFLSFLWSDVICDVIRSVLQQAVLCALFLFVVEVILPRTTTSYNNKKSNVVRQIQPGASRFAKVWSHEIPHAVWTVAGGKIIKTVIGNLVQAGAVTIVPLPSSSTLSATTTSVSVWTLFVVRWVTEVVVYFLLFDAFFYFGHRLFHTKYLYWIHKPHHESTAPNAIAGFSFNPLEGNLFGLFLPVYAWMCTAVGGGGGSGGGGGILKATLITCGMLQLFQTMWIHSGYEFCSHQHFESDWWSKILTPTFHDRHHERYNCNYSGFFTYLDDWFGTADSDWRQKYASWQRYGRPMVKISPNGNVTTKVE